MPYREPEKIVPNRFASAMARRTDEELLAITSGPAADWQPEAIEAAREELETRGLAEAEREDVVEQIEAAREAAREPLEPWKRVVAFVSGALGVLGGVFLLYFNRKHREFGETEKSKEMRRWFFYGLVVHFSIVGLGRLTGC